MLREDINVQMVRSLLSHLRSSLIHPNPSKKNTSYYSHMRYFYNLNIIMHTYMYRTNVKRIFCPYTKTVASYRDVDVTFMTTLDAFATIHHFLSQKAPSPIKYKIHSSYLRRYAQLNIVDIVQYLLNFYLNWGINF